MKFHLICSSSAGCTDARIICLLAGTEDLWLSAHLAYFPSLRWHACKPHSTGTLYLILWKYLSHILPAVFTWLLSSFCFSLKKVTTRQLFIMTITLKVRKASLLVTQCIWWHNTDQNEWGPDHMYVFVLFTYIFWCAVCGMPGVLLPGATEAEDGSFQAETVLQRTCRNLWTKDKEKTRL